MPQISAVPSVFGSIPSGSRCVNVSKSTYKDLDCHSQITPILVINLDTGDFLQNCDSLGQSYNLRVCHTFQCIVVQRAREKLVKMNGYCGAFTIRRCNVYISSCAYILIDLSSKYDFQKKQKISLKKELTWLPQMCTDQVRENPSDEPCLLTYLVRTQCSKLRSFFSNAVVCIHK